MKPGTPDTATAASETFRDHVESLESTQCSRRRFSQLTTGQHRSECLAQHRARSAQAEIPQDEQDDHDGADEPDDSVHDSIPFSGLRQPKLVSFGRCMSARLRFSLCQPRHSICALTNIAAGLAMSTLSGDSGLGSEEASPLKRARARRCASHAAVEHEYDRPQCLRVSVPGQSSSSPCAAIRCWSSITTSASEQRRALGR